MLLPSESNSLLWVVPFPPGTVDNELGLRKNMFILDALSVLLRFVWPLSKACSCRLDNSSPANSLLGVGGVLLTALQNPEFERIGREFTTSTGEARADVGSVYAEVGDTPSNEDSLFVAANGLVST